MTASLDNLSRFGVGDTDYAPVMSGQGVIVHEWDDEIPLHLGEPALYRMFVMPVRLRRKTKGGIILADETKDAALWYHQLGKVAAVGPCCFQGPAFRGLDIPEAHKPKVGDLIFYSGRSPNRFEYMGKQFVVINDDQWLGRPLPGHIEGYKFLGLEV